MRFITSALLLLLSAYSAIAQGAWVTKNDFAGSARSRAVSFSIGNYAYVGTGYDGNQQLQDFRRYDPAADTWTQIADFPGGSRENAVAFSIGGKGYVGTGSSGPYNATVYHRDFWRYDPATDTWIQVADFGGVARTSAVVFVIDSKAYVGIGTNGNYQKDLWEYDPTADTWTKKADFAGESRTGGVAFAINNTGYVGAGLYYNNGSPHITNDLFAYDPTTNAWSEKIFGHLYLSRQHGQSFVLDGKAYLATGGGSDKFVSYDPQSNTLSFEDAANTIQSSNRTSAIAFTVNGQAYLGTGYHYEVFAGGNFKKDLWTYQPPNLPAAPTNLTATLLDERTVQLEWTDNSNGETHFVLEWSLTGEEETFGQERSIPSNKTTAVEYDLEENQSYYYRVKTVNSLGSSSFSNIISTHAPVRQPSGFIAYPLSSHQIKLEWSNVSSVAKKVVVERSEDRHLFSPIDTLRYGSREYTDKTVNANELYSYRLKVIAADEQYTHSFVVSATVDKELGAWKIKSEVPSSVRGAGFSVGNKGYVGFNNFTANLPLRQAFWEYDGVTDTWKRLNDIPFTETVRVGSFVVGNSIFVGGGSSLQQVNTKEWWMYSPNSDQWSRIADAPVSGPEVSFSVGEEGYFIKSGILYCYNIANNEWTSKPIQNGETFLHAFTVGDQAYLGTQSGEFWNYNPRSATWAEVAKFPGYVHRKNIIFSSDKYGYIVAGANNEVSYRTSSGIRGFSYRLRVLWKYDPAEDKWQTKYPLSEPLQISTGDSGFTLDQNLFLIGTYGAYRFDPNVLNGPNEFKINYDEVTPYLTWRDDSDSESSYTVERAGLRTENFETVATLAADTEMYVDHNTTEG